MFIDFNSLLFRHNMLKVLTFFSTRYTNIHTRFRPPLHPSYPFSYPPSLLLLPSLPPSYLLFFPLTLSPTQAKKKLSRMLFLSTLDDGGGAVGGNDAIFDDEVIEDEVSLLVVVSIVVVVIIIIIVIIVIVIVIVIVTIIVIVITYCYCYHILLFLSHIVIFIYVFILEYCPEFMKYFYLF